MIRKPFMFLYGIRLIALWMLLPFVFMFIPMLVSEFSAKMSTEEVRLLKQTYSFYPEDVSCFEVDVNGTHRSIYVPVTCKEGEVITVILKDGEYYKTPEDAKDIHVCTSFTGRFMKVCNNNFGYHTVGAAAVLLISFLITADKSKTIRSDHPKFSKVTDIVGAICSGVMSIALVYAVSEGTLYGIGIAYIGLFVGIIYTAVFVAAWVFGTALSSYE